MPTNKEIKSAIDELMAAMMESVEAKKAADDASTRIRAAHQRLLLAQQTIHSFHFN